MNLGKYIHELLLENETVIIPGFGAFISDYKSAEINTETNELKPPSKEIAFNQQIRNNDGLLVGSVALGEGVSHFDALKLIEKERENIINQLDKGEKVIVAETGELYVNEQNEIQFTSFSDDNLLLDSFGLETVSLEELVQNVEEKENKTVVNDIPDKPKNEKPEPVEVTELKEPESPVIEKNVLTEPKKEENKKRSWLLLLLVLIPIIIVGIFLLKQKSDLKTTPSETVEDLPQIIQKEEPVITKDTIVKDSVSVTMQDSTVEEDIQATPVETMSEEPPKFYLVGGSFKAEENAENYLLELKSKGFEPFLLGKRGNFYIVGIGAYQTEREALAAKRKFYEENPNSGVWVMEEK